MIKIETHTHTLGGSNCASVPIDKLICEYKNAGYGGIVITNHVCEGSFENYPGDTYREKLDYYFSLYYNALKIGQRLGLKIFMGAEIRAFDLSGGFMEFMVYGAEERFFYDNKPLYELTQEELFKLCDKNGLLFYQTHPFRNRIKTGDPKYMHGAECFNGHFHHVNNNEQAKLFCVQNNLIKMSGTDFHDAGQPITAGIFIPETVNDNNGLKECIFNGNYQLFEDEKKYLDNLTKK